MTAKICEGKTKKVFAAEGDESKIIIFFKDDITAFNGKRHDIIPEKGALSAYISSALFKLLNENGVKTHFIEYIPPNKMLAWKLNMIPLEVVCRNIATGSLLKRLPILKKGEKLKKPIIEFFYKSDELGDPLLNECHLEYIVDREAIEEMKQMTLKANEVLKKFFEETGFTLVDFKLEFGTTMQGELMIGDELTCDTMRLWVNGESFDKDIYRKGGSPEDVLKAYRKVYEAIKERIELK